MAQQEDSSTNKSPNMKSVLIKTVSENIRMETTELHEDINSQLIVPKSHAEQDLNIQTTRVLYVLQRAIEKMQVVAYLPVLIEKRLLCKYFDKDTIQFLMNACHSEVELYDSNKGSKDNKDRRGSKIQTTMFRGAKADHSMIEVIQLMYNNKKIKNDVINNPNVSYDVASQNLIDAMKDLKLAAEQKMSVSAADEKLKLAELRKAWRDNCELLKEVERLESQLSAQRRDFNAEYEQKMNLIKQYETQMVSLKAAYAERINKRIQDSEKKMGLEAATSDMKITKLRNKAQDVQHQYQSLLDSHILYEKGLRAKRAKVEIQLASWLAKYDADIGDRNNEMEELTRLYNEEKAEMDKIQSLINEQEDEYDLLMAERAEEERRRLENQIATILMNHSARVIQNAWRTYWLRKLAKKKAKKARAKEKKERAAARLLEKKSKKMAASEIRVDEGETSSQLPAEKKLKKKKSVGKKKGKKGKKANEVPGRGADLVKGLESLVKGDILDDLSTPAFAQNAPDVDL